jgi:hypothetical protein
MGGNEMTKEEAEAIVVEDTRQSHPDLSWDDALEYAFHTVDPQDLDGEPGDRYYDAYAIVLSNDRPHEWEMMRWMRS